MANCSDIHQKCFLKANSELFKVFLLYTPQIQVHKPSWVSTTLKRYLKLKWRSDWVSLPILVHLQPNTNYVSSVQITKLCSHSLTNAMSVRQQNCKDETASNLPSAAHETTEKAQCLMSRHWLRPPVFSEDHVNPDTAGEVNHRREKWRNEFSWAAFKQQLYCGTGNATFWFLSAAHISSLESWPSDLA